MYWQSPANLIFLPLAWTIILLLYLLLRRDRREIVSSVLLWRQVSDHRFRVDHSRASRILGYLRRNRSLLLELFAVTLLILSLAGPFCRCDYPLREKPVLLVVDNESLSLSGMGEEVAAWLEESIPSGKKVILCESSPKPRKVGEVSGDENLLLAIRDRIDPSSVRCAPDSLLGFLIYARASGEMSEILVLSGDPLLYPYMSTLFEERFAGGARDRLPAAICSAEWKSAGEETIRVVVGVGDEREAPEEPRERRRAEVALRDEKGEVSSKIVEMKQGRNPIFFAVPPGAGDFFSVDLLGRGSPDGGEGRDDAPERLAPTFFIARNHSGREEVTVTIVSEGSPFLERFFDLRSNVSCRVISSKVFFEKGIESSNVRNATDILVFEGLDRDLDILPVLPDIRKGICFFAPRSECRPLFRLRGIEGDGVERALYREIAHPILRSVSVPNVQSRSAGLLDPGPWPQETLLRTSLSPSLTAGSIAGRPFVVFLDSPGQLARSLGDGFPIVLENTLEFLHTASDYGIPASVARGERMSSDFLTGAQIALTGSGEGDLSVTHVGSCFVPFQNGFYKARSRGREVLFTVNDRFTGVREKSPRLWRVGPEDRPDPEGSVLARLDAGDGLPSLSTALSFFTGGGEGDVSQTGDRSLVQYLAAVAMLLLLAEWYASMRVR